jgi:hypothetical protein
LLLDLVGQLGQPKDLGLDRRPSIQSIEASSLASSSGPTATTTRRLTAAVPREMSLFATVVALDFGHIAALPLEANVVKGLD